MQTINTEDMYLYKAKYVSNYDGDSIRLDIDLGFNMWMKDQIIRLYGINTPELRGKEREQGLIVRDWVREQLESADEIILKSYKDKKGKYGRWLAELVVDGRVINNELLKLGYAVPY